MNTISIAGWVGLVICCLTAGCGASPNTAPSGATKAEDAINVVVLRYSPNSASTEQREQGFLDTLKKEFPQIHILSDEQFAGATREGALAKAENLLGRFGSQIDGWFSPCEPVTFGAIQAIRSRGLSGIKIVGFDSGSEMVAALSAGEVHGLILQDPVRMGYLGVKTAIEKLEGKPVEKVISTGENLITPENMHQPRSKELLMPDLGILEANLPPPTNQKYTIAVIPKGTLHDFWKSIHTGALLAQKELGNVEIIWKGPTREDDKEAQIQVVENFVNRGVDAIVLAPLDRTALVAPVEQAMKKGIPVVIIDSALDSENIASYVATDNYHGGVIAARHLGKLLAGKD